jgi:di/tricarboxylate transporter
MTTEAWITLATALGVLLTLAFTHIGADLVMLAALTALMTIDALAGTHLTFFAKPTDALAGFANEGVITVGVLFVVAAGIRETGGMSWIASRVLGRPRSVTGAQVRMAVPVAVMSSVMNNTPLVAMMLPVVSDWGKRLRISPSRLMMPLSFAAILGGLCTLIGTSTNVVVNGLFIAHQQSTGQPAVGMGMFDITYVGLPCAVAGIAYIALASRWLLKDRTPAVSVEGDPREYTLEMLVEAGGPIANRTIEEAGLRQLPGAYLMEIEREGEVIPMVGPEQRLEAGDQLVFVGVVDSIVELQKIRGLRPATDQLFKLNAPRANRCLIEAVVSDSCRLVGQTIRDGRFRSVYNAVVIAVGRNGKRLRQKIGDIVLEPGDTLLIEAHPSFADNHRNSRDFYLVSAVAESSPLRHERAWIALIILAAMVALAATEVLSMLNAALLAAGAMVLTRCITGPIARRSIDWQVLLVIGAALGLGKALESTGAAKTIADEMLQWGGGNPMLALIVVYGLTMLFTEIMTNNAAAALMFPIAMATSATLGVSPMPFIIAIMVAASCGFATPIGYQTNLMVYGPGGYRFSDFIRFGGLLNLLIWIVTMLVTPLVWPF